MVRKFVFIWSIIGGVINIKKHNSLVDKINISFDANLVIQINNTNIPPKKIRNKIYENQNDWVELPVIIEIITV